MAKFQIQRGATSTILHVFALDTGSTAGAGLTGLAFGDFSCRYVRPGETLSGAITAQDITTLGTYETPTANTNVRIKEMDAANFAGIYEVHLHNDWLNTTGSRRALTILLSAAGMAPLPIEIELTATDNQDGTRGGMTALPNAAAEAAGGLPTLGTGSGQVNPDGNGNVSADTVRWAGTVVAVGGVAGLPQVDAKAVSDAIGSDQLAATAAGEIADAVWDEARAGHTAAGSFGEGVLVETLNTQARAEAAAMPFRKTIAGARLFITADRRSELLSVFRATAPAGHHR